MIALPLRTAAASILALASAAVWFATPMDESAKSLLATALMVLSALLQPRNVEGEGSTQPPLILWRDRDIGQQLTIIIFHGVVLTLLAGLAYVLATSIEGFVGNVIAAALLCAGVWVTVRNWKNRNAG
ncbi:hypothetical protein [Qipengyuania seohaensis]|uniref:hypothetical protein n=1 Tax=Qipengyuania seohaensis TaxID=266951 RepID=UPI000C2235FC|nr:hypothetical protein [Qipengyuania seohaensis]